MVQHAVCAAVDRLYTRSNGEQTVASQVMPEVRTGPGQWVDIIKDRVSRRLNRDMPANVTIRFQVWWPLILIPIVFINQLLAPHPVWVALLITLAGLYGIAFAWVRNQAPHVTAVRERVGAILVAGDTLREDFELRNNSRLPVFWAEFADESDVPHYQAGRVVACSAYGFYRWRAEAVCERRGVFRLGPYRLRLGDPFGIFGVDIDFDYAEALLIYPRVAQLPSLRLPHGNTSGAGAPWARRRPIRGALPSATVSEYRPGDSLRHIHWGSSARQRRLMVKDLEIEPSGDVWIVLDLNRQAHTLDGPHNTLEYGIIVAASLAAELLSGGERRAVGLLAASGSFNARPGEERRPETGSRRETNGRVPAAAAAPEASLSAPSSMHIEPQPGQAQLWTILSALAPVQACDVSLAELLYSSREALGRRRTLIVVTPQVTSLRQRQKLSHRADADSAPRGFPPLGVAAESETPARVGAPEAVEADRPTWLAELVHLRSIGLDSSVLLITPGEDDPAAIAQSAVDALAGMLAGYDIGCQALNSGKRLQSVLTFRRTRRVIRSTPTGGVVSYEIEEEVS